MLLNLGREEKDDFNGTRACQVLRLLNLAQVKSVQEQAPKASVAVKGGCYNDETTKLLIALSRTGRETIGPSGVADSKKRYCGGRSLIMWEQNRP